MSFQTATIEKDLRLFTERGLLAEAEAAQVVELVDAAFAFTEAMGKADSIHVHVNAEKVVGLPGEDVLTAACREATGDDRERKFSFDSGLNVIFALDPTAQDEFIDGAVTKPKPYVDHLGIDLRDESEDTKRVFEAIPKTALGAGWRHVAQEGPVRCCHTEMGPKHWVYPPEGPSGDRRPIEFAWGELKIRDTYQGCDYRPIDPAHPLAAQATVTGSCETGACEPVAAVVEPAKIFVFEECSCNVSPSTGLLEVLSAKYARADIRAFDMAKPEGLLPLPPALFLALSTEGSGCLPALVVDGQVRTQGWLPAVADAVALIETPAAVNPAARPLQMASTDCCAPGTTCC
jgi:hypothetical protein